VGVTVWKAAVSGDHIHFFEIEHFEDGFVEVQTVFTGVLFDFAIEPRQFG